MLGLRASYYFLKDIIVCKFIILTIISLLLSNDSTVRTVLISRMDSEVK